jgi:membrane protein YdbS with pleckstrin-like domain
MRLATNKQTVPARVNKYLLPYEHRVVTVHQHPAVLLRPLFFLLAGLSLAGLLTWAGYRHENVLIGIWVLFGILLAWFIGKVVQRAVEYFVVTSQRMLLLQGVFTRKMNMMPLAKVTDMSFQQTPLGQLLGYGEFIVESAGTELALSHVTYLPYPEQLYLEVCGLIFKEEPQRHDPGI